MHKTRNLFRAKTAQKGSGFLILRYFFVQIAIAFLFCNSLIGMIDAIDYLPQTAANQLSKLCLFTRMLVPMRSTRKSFVVLHRLYAARGEIAKRWAISSTR